VRLKFTLLETGHDGQNRARDIVVTADVTATVADLARTVIRAGAGDGRLLPHALDRTASLTILVHRRGGRAVVLDPADPIGISGVKAGAVIEVIREQDAGNAERMVEPAGYIDVLDGPQSGARYTIIQGENGIGRERTNRVELHDRSVSRHHLEMTAFGSIRSVRDLGSANGTDLVTASGELHRLTAPTHLSHPTVLRLGDVHLRIHPVATGGPGAPRARATVRHQRSPRVDPVHAPTPLELPSPPTPAEPSRFPLVAMVAPLAMGAALFAVTQSALSIAFVALSPLIMIGSWLDGRVGQRRRLKKQRREFTETLTTVRDEVSRRHEVERPARQQESVPLADLLTAARDRTPVLWTRRSEHRSYLEIRLGSGELPSRTVLDLPSRGSSTTEDWAQVEDAHTALSSIADVPVLERLDLSGSLGIAGEGVWADSITRSVLVQLFGLHSPADVVFTAFLPDAEANAQASAQAHAGADAVTGRHTDADWDWLKWVPHADSVYSPIRTPHLTATARDRALLLTELEGIIATRTASASSRTIRSRDQSQASDTDSRLAAVQKQPLLPTIIVLVVAGDDDAEQDLTRLVGLAEDGPDVGVHVIWSARSMADVPAACRTTVDATTTPTTAHFVRSGTVVTLDTVERVDVPEAEAFARSLTPVVDAGARVLDESDLPRSVKLADIDRRNLLDDPREVIAGWESTDSLTSRWTPGAERDPGTLPARIGQSDAGTVEIDLRTHGPHALVGGTTGAGKSEFLQTWILSLAAAYSPDRVTFLLVDYKGGAAFADCVALPHTVGLVTDLDQHLVRRALTSLRAELRYREELLNEHRAKDLAGLERRSEVAAPPLLLIVIDEFAALAKEIPEFVDGVIDIAQRGRSLGLHLIMATQRPAGVIGDNLRANTNLRVALRMADASDSNDVIGIADAAHFAPETPGRAVVKIGAGRVVHFQTAYLGGRSDGQRRDAIDLSDLRFGHARPWAIAPERAGGDTGAAASARDIERLVRNIQVAADTLRLERPRKPWVDQLPAFLALPGEAVGSATDSDLLISVGRVDDPTQQRQTDQIVDLKAAGNVAIFGAPGAGKTTALITFAIAAILRDERTRIYGIDAASGRLATLIGLPATGDIVPADDTDRAVRLLGMLRDLIDERENDRSPTSPVILLLDGFGAFRDLYEHHGPDTGIFTALVDILRAGRHVGVHVVVASERAMSLPSAIAASIGETFVLRMLADHDYGMVGASADMLRTAPAGRAIHLSSEREVQFAMPASAPDDEALDAALAHIAQTLRSRGIENAPGIPEVPTSLARDELPRAANPQAFAVETTRLTAVDVPLTGMMLVTGPAGSGRTTAVRSILAARHAHAAEHGLALDLALLSPRASTLAHDVAWSHRGDSAQDRPDLITALIEALGGTPRTSTASLLSAIPLIGSTGAAADEPEPARAQLAFPRAGHQGIVVIEDVGGFDGSGDESALATLLKLLRRSDLTVIVEGENATLTSVWELASPLRGARWGLALQPDANDMPSVYTANFPCARRADFPPGRGFLVRGGAVTGVHVAQP
jgi:S-DNA-T family DNA segregation ATPase FtsK/SpoIIIE